VVVRGLQQPCARAVGLHEDGPVVSGGERVHALGLDPAKAVALVGRHDSQRPDVARERRYRLVRHDQPLDTVLERRDADRARDDRAVQRVGERVQRGLLAAGADHGEHLVGRLEERVRGVHTSPPRATGKSPSRR